MMNNTVLLVFLQLAAAMLLCLPTAHSFSLVALPRCPATVWRARPLHLRAGAFELESDAMGRCAEALCEAGDEIVAAARFWAKTGIFSWGPFRLVCQLGVWNFYDN